jgi:nucleolar protein 4
VETAADGTEPEKTSVDSQSSKNENHAGSSQSDEEESEAGDQDDETDEDDEDDEDMDKEEHVKKTLMTSNEATLFIRNLPFTTTDEDLYEHFEDFGPVRYARIVIDHATERPRGTGFVCFRTKDDADVCLREAPRATKAKDSKGKKDSSASNGPSILENELADYSGRYTLDGRVLHITRAVDKSEADRLTAEGTASRNKRDRDKRRLYLLGEGTIPSNSPLYQKLSASEIAMRDASAKQRRKLIDTNPSLHLSLTRLSVRNIPRSVSSKDLKTLAREAVVGFAKDVKESKRQALSKEERARGGEEMARAEKERKRKGKGVVKQAKIIFEGSEGGKVEEASGRSRGYGFIEYYTHRSALMGLRWLNGHSIEYQAKEKKVKATKDDIQDRKKRLIVEFAIENAQVVKRRKEKEDKAREKPKNTEEPHQAKGVAAQEQGKPSRTPNKKRKHDSSAQGGDSGKDEASKSKQRKIIAKKRQARKIQRRQVKAKA